VPAIESQIVYVDDSGSEPDPRVRIIVAAFCVSTEKKWKKFESAWKAVAEDAGFIHFHMTEFAGCRRDSWCRDCKGGRTDAARHPWREWSNSKRKAVLGQLVQIVSKYTEQGFGIAFTKEDIKRYVLDSTSALRMLAPDQFGNEHFTFAATTCGGELARWRAKQNSFPPIKLVFDLCTERQKRKRSSKQTKSNRNSLMGSNNGLMWMQMESLLRVERIPCNFCPLTCWLGSLQKSAHSKSILQRRSVRAGPRT
jgi:hypothetical protein